MLSTVRDYEPIIYHIINNIPLKFSPKHLINVSGVISIYLINLWNVFYIPEFFSIGNPYWLNYSFIKLWPNMCIEYCYKQRIGEN